MSKQEITICRIYNNKVRVLYYFYLALLCCKSRLYFGGRRAIPTACGGRSTIGVVVAFRLVHSVEPHSVIVMDNASVHSVIDDKAPSSNTRKSDIMTWLSKRNIPHSGSQTRTELLQLVKMQQPACNTYEIDNIAREHGHRVFWLPHYHCRYNPIELIWSRVKGR